MFFFPKEANTGLHCRNVAYDSSIGGCLHALHSTCSDDVVKFTAADLIDVFYKSILKTKSPELKVILDLPHFYICKLGYSHDGFILA